MDLTSIQFVYFTLSLMATTTVFLSNSCKAAGSFLNPILDMPNDDQYIYLHTDGYYYMTIDDNSVLYLYKSETLSDWRLAERKIIRTKNVTGTYYSQSEIHFLSGNWYIYFYSFNLLTSQHHMFAIKALNPENPFGQYSDEIRITPATPQEDFDDIDGTILEHTDGRIYFVHAGRATNNIGPRRIFISPMSNPTTISAPRTLIRDTMSTWDTEVRSPQILRKNKTGNQTFLVFNGYSNRVYCLGLMGINDGKDPLVAANWWHHPNGTVFASNPTANVYSPGFVSFTYSPDLTEIWMAYSAWSSVNGEDWTSRLDKIEWNEDGPSFQQPLDLEFQFLSQEERFHLCIFK